MRENGEDISYKSTEQKQDVSKYVSVDFKCSHRAKVGLTLTLAEKKGQDATTKDRSQLPWDFLTKRFVEESDAVNPTLRQIALPMFQNNIIAEIKEATLV